MTKEVSNSIRTENLKFLLDLMTGYQQSNVLFTLVELKIPQILHKEKFSAEKLAERLKIEPLAMERFLSAAVSVGLLKKHKNIFSNTKMSEQFLVEDKEFYLGGQIRRHQKRSYQVWAKLTKKLKKWEYANNDASPPETNDQGAQAMAEQHNLALINGFALAEIFDFSPYKKVLDLGGGTGAMSIALCQSYPHLKAAVFELPENTKIAAKFIKKNKLTKRIEIINGDFKTDALPDDFDIVLLANFMSVSGDKENIKLLKKLYKGLPSGGACILSGWIIDDSHQEPQISILFCLEDICREAPDVERSEKVYTRWLQRAGFKKIQCKTYLEPTKMLYGYKT